jgi:Hydrogenase expression/synthesis hypA family.
MHELGIVFHIINTVERVGQENNLTSVSSVTLQLGEVSGVIQKELTDCWNWAVRKTELLRDARLNIETIPAYTMCEDCKNTYETVSYGRICPYCGSERTFLIQGNEIYLKEIAASEDGGMTDGQDKDN